MRLARDLSAHLLRGTGLMRPEVVVFDITHRCNSRCAGCAFREPEAGELPSARWVELAREAADLGFRELVLTGGEPLSHPDITTLLPALARHLPVALMTNGLALRKHAALVRDAAARVFVSWDAATEETYLRLRGLNGLRALREGAEALRGRPLHARVTLWAENIDELDQIREMTEASGCDAMSVLAADTSSAAFGDREGHTLEEGPLGQPPRPEQLPRLSAFLSAATRDPFIEMSAYARDRSLRLSEGQVEAPRCLAPWTSGVVDPTGAWRHCFFLPTAAHTRGGLRAAMRESRPERRHLDVDRHPVCARCVCWRG